MNTAKRPCLPLLKSMAEAVTLSKKEKDNFYIVAFHIQRWLARANKEAVAQYADKRNPRDRCHQTGSAWRAFRELFGELPDNNSATSSPAWPASPPTTTQFPAAWPKPALPS